MTLALMVLTSTVQSVSASYTPTTALTGSQYSAIYGATGTSGTANIISNYTANPSTFKPTNGEKTSIHFDLSTSATVWVDVSQNGLLINRLYGPAGRSLLTGTFDVPWDGYNAVTTKTAVDGTYQFIITAKADSNGITYPPAQGNIVVTSDPGLLPLVITPGNASPNPFNPDLHQLTYVNYTLNSKGNVDIEVVDGLRTVAILSPSPNTLNAGTYQVSWDGIDPQSNKQSKTYSIRFTGKNAATPIPYQVSVPVTVDYGTIIPPPTDPKVLYIYPDTATFDPHTSSERIHYQVDKSTNAVLKILNSSNVAVRTYASSGVTNGNDYFKDWDGHPDNSNAYVEGTYTAMVELHVTKNGVDTVVDSKKSSPFTLAFVSQNNSVPVVTSVTANPSSINLTNNETTSLNFTYTNVNGTAITGTKIEILDNTQTAKKTVNNPTLPMIWNGAMDNGSPLPAGTYTVKVTVNNSNGPGYGYANVTLTTSGQNNTAPVVTSLYAAPTTVDPYCGDTAGLSLNYNLDKPATSAMVQILDSNNTVVRTISGTGTSSNSTNIVNFSGLYSNGNPLPVGTYTAKVSATNAYGTGTKNTTVSVVNSCNNNSAPVVLSVSANPTSFNPSNNETSTISYTLDKAATSAYVQFLDNNGTIRRTISGTGTSSNSTNPVTFNGRDDSGSILPNGTYTAKVYATNAYGTNYGTTTVTLTGNGGTGNCNNSTGTPNLTSVSASPSNFNPNNQSATVYYNLDRSANVTVQILNGNNSSLVRTLSDNVCRNSGSGNLNWDGRDMYGNTVTNGSYTVKVTANNGYGTDTEYTYLTVNNNGTYNGGNTGTLVLNMYVQPEIFNPRNNQTSTVYYNLNQTATVTTQIVDRNGVVIRTLVDNVTRYSNNYAYTTAYGSYNYADQWNGRDVNGNIVPDNIYQFRVSANANGTVDTESAWVEVNTDGIIIGFPNGSTCGNYIDVSSNSPYCKAIQEMTNLGVFTGYADGSFRPYTPINRAETVKVILLALGIPVVDDGGTLFSDTDGSAWYAPFLRTAKRLGIIRGYPDGTFRPNQTVNRVELLKVFLESSGVNIPYCNYAPYNDTPVNADTRWYIDYACYAKSNGLMHDDGSGHFSPAAAMTRGDVADLFYQFQNRSLYNQNNNPYVNGNYVYGYYNNTPTSQTYASTPRVSALTVNPSNFNPNNGGTATINYTLDRAATTVSVQVVDSNSTIRRTLYNASTSATTNSISFNGRDDNNNILPSGTYTVRVSATNNYGTGFNVASVYVNSYGYNYNGNQSVNIQNFAFNPSVITISRGTTVTWTNYDSTTHSVTSTSGSELSSQYLLYGNTYSHTFYNAGTYYYHCRLHTSMTATVIVQ